MFRTLLFVGGFLFTASASAQIAHDLTIFSEDGLKFTLLLNGEAVNDAPQSSVTVNDTNNDYVRMVVKFESDSIPPVEKKFLQIAEPGTGPKGPVSTVYAIKEKKGEYVVRFVSRS